MRCAMCDVLCAVCGVISRRGCWEAGDGANEMGENLPCVELGVGRSGLRAAAYAVHASALLDDGRLRSRGRGNCGQLGGDAR